MVTFAITVKKLLLQLQKDMCSLETEVIVGKPSSLTIQPIIMEAIKRGQLVDPQLEAMKQEGLQNK